MEQRWLSKTGICTVLGITENSLKTLVKQKCIVKIGNPSGNVRYLDPTPEYAELLRIGESLYRKKNEGLPRDFNTAALFTIAEVAEILNWSIYYARDYLATKKIPCIKVHARLKLYSIETVRKLVWARTERKQISAQRSPFLLRELIDFFWKYHAADSEGLPTDSQFDEDDLLQRKLTVMMKYPSPKRELALAEFMSKVELAKRIISTLNK